MSSIRDGRGSIYTDSLYCITLLEARLSAHYVKLRVAQLLSRFLGRAAGEKKTCVHKFKPGVEKHRM